MNDMKKYFIDEYNANSQHLEVAENNQIKVWQKEKVNVQPLLLECSLSDSQQEHMQYYNLKEVHYDNEKMLLSQLPSILGALNGKMQCIPSMRANMGCGVFATILGIKQMVFEDKMPWVQDHLDKDTISKIDIDKIAVQGEFSQGLEHMEYYKEQLGAFNVHTFPMDCQGVFDTAHLVYGDKIFYDMYDDPAFVHRLQELCLQATIIGMEACFDVLADSDNKVYHYNSLVIPKSVGGLKISEDTPTLLSKDQIQEFVMPYTDRLLDHFGGGYMHYCGKNPHLYKVALESKYVNGINFGNPDMHDMPQVLADVAAKDKIFYGSIPNYCDISQKDHFKTILDASKKDGNHNVLLQLKCDLSERDGIIEDWYAAH